MHEYIEAVNVGRFLIECSFAQIPGKGMISKLGKLAGKNLMRGPLIKFTSCVVFKPITFHLTKIRTSEMQIQWNRGVMQKTHSNFGMA